MNDVRDFVNMAWDNLLMDNLEIILYDDGTFAVIL